MIVGIQAIIFRILEENNEKYYVNHKRYIYRSRYKKIFLILSCTELIILAGLRGHDIGADTTVYLSALVNYRNMPHDSILLAKLVYPYKFEWGYFFLTKLCAWVGVSETLFLFLIAILSYVPIFKYIYKESNSPFLSILIYFSFGYFSYSLGIFRQMIAINIMLCGVKYIFQKNLLRYLVCLFFAMSFHFTAIVMLPLYWIYKIDLRKYTCIIFLLEFILFLYGRVLIMDILKIFTGYSSYISSKYDFVGGSYKNIILLNLILIGNLFILKNKSVLKEKDRMILAQLVCAIFLQIIGYHMGIFGRIVIYYSIFLLSIIPQTIDRMFTYKSSVFIRLIFLIFLIILFYFEFNNNIYVTPYYFN